MKQPPPTPTFPRNKAEKSPHNQHVSSFIPGFEATLAARATSGREGPAPRSCACDERAGRPRAPERRVLNVNGGLSVTNVVLKFRV